jgi:hypothetical protein
VVLSDLVWPARLGLEELVLERCWSNSPDTNNSNGAVNNKLQKYLQIPPKVCYDFFLITFLRIKN